MAERLEDLARLEGHEVLGRRRPVYRSERGILKVERTDEAAAAESRTLEMAGEVLGARLRVPRLYELSGRHLLMEDVGRLPLSTQSHACAAAEYLATIHLTAIDEALIARFVESGRSHYWKDGLRRRLRTEVGISQRGTLSNDPVEEFRTATEVVAGLPFPRHSHVVGHGDPTVKNFVVGNDQKPCAVDWKDFGLSNRWYEVAHFITGLEPAHREAASTAYRRRAGLIDFPGWESAYVYGVALSSIIRIGTVARNATTANPRSARSFKRSLLRLRTALESPKMPTLRSPPALR